MSTRALLDPPGTVTWPTPLPRWFYPWAGWRDRGGIPAERPSTVPAKIPPWAWDRYRVHRGTVKRAVSYSFRPPVAFYVQAHGTGPREALAGAKQAGCTGYAIDPLADDFSSWYPIGRALDLDLSVWSRGDGYTRELHADLQRAAGKLGAIQTFPNVEDDELRAMHTAGTLADDLAFFGQELDGAPVRGVLTNFWTNPLFHGSALSHLTVLPEIQPRTDPAARDVNGCVERGLQFFDTCLPLLDGREAGREYVPWVGVYGGVWPSENISDWGRWPRS